MGLLVECPACHYRNSIKKESCKCGQKLSKLSGKVYWIEYYDNVGTRKRERIGPSKQAAEQRLRNVMTARTEDRHIEKDRSSKISLGEIAKWYLTLPEVKAKASFVRDTCSIKNLIRLLGENIKVKELTLGKVESYRQRRLEESSPRRIGLKTTPSTVNKEVVCLKTILNRAVRHGLIEQNPINDMKKLIENNVRMRVLSEDEFQRLVLACPEHLKPIVILAFYTGMRKSEIIFLEWNEVDLRTGFIRLTAERTKTKTARSIPLPGHVKELLSKIPTSIDTERVFLKDGKPFEDFKKSFRSACLHSGLGDFTFHDLRHCAINNLRLAGNDYFKIMAVSGHKTVAVFKRYNLVTEEELSKIQWEKQNDATEIHGHLYGHQ